MTRTLTQVVAAMPAVISLDMSGFIPVSQYTMAFYDHESV